MASQEDYLAGMRGTYQQLDGEDFSDEDFCDEDDDEGAGLEIEKNLNSVIAQDGPSSDFGYLIRLATVVHGFLDGIDTTPASLIVVQYNLSYPRDERLAYRFFRSWFRFQGHDKSANPSESPSVDYYAPSEKPGEKAGETVVEYSDGHRLTSTIRGDYLLKADISGKKSVKLTGKRSYSLSCQSYPSWNDKNPGFDQVTWYMKDNPELENGLPPVIRVAMLVRRGNLEDFTATFELKVRESLRDSSKNRYKRTFGLLGEGGPINFNPGADPAGELPDHLDRNNLSVYKDPAKLRQLTVVWEYGILGEEELTGRRFIEKKGLR